MTKRAQRQFVGDLLRNIRHDIMGAIHSGLIPTEWDGIELREFIADKTQRSRAAHALVGRRAKDDHNHMIIRAGL
ncbi:MAG: hypothetical protein JNL29_14540 [Nitrospira sp.]|nr:hypothetical protein [Nitrospira sp.]MBS0167402.1 hypothetical protein [Nitrospira sp.]